MASEPEFLTLDEVLTIHADQLATWGGAEGIRDKGALLSALAMPEQHVFGEYVHGDVFLMAAAYAFHIAEGQPFLDGNKRTGLGAALTFLRLIGFHTPDPDFALYEAMIAIGKRQMTKNGLAALLRDLTNA